MADPRLKAELVLEAQQAVETLRRFLANAEGTSKASGKSSGNVFYKGFEEEIAKIKIDLSNKVTVDPARLTNLRNSINNALSSGQISNVQAAGLFNNLDGAASKAGANAGTGLGASIIGAATSFLSGVSFQSIFAGITGAVGQYREAQLSNLSLAGAVNATNNRLEQQKKVLLSNTATLEQKAIALGLDTKNMYKSVTASNQVSDASKSLEDQIRLQTRAFDDSQDVLERQLETQRRSVKASDDEIKSKDRETQAVQNKINAIQKETDEKLKQLRITLGGEQLETERQTLETKRNNLEIERDTARVANDPVSAKFKQLEIDRLEDAISLNRNKLDAIDLQTEAIQKQDDQQIDALQAKRTAIELQKQDLQFERDKRAAALDVTQEIIKQNRVKFDANIEPLKRKIEDIRASIKSVSSGEPTKVLNKDFEEQVKALTQKTLSNIPDLTLDQGKIDGVVDNLVGKFGRTLSKSDITAAVGELVQGGITDASQLNSLIERFVETSARSRVGAQNQGQAILNLAQGFKLGNSAITELSGLSENFATNIIPKGTQKLREQALAAGDKQTADRLARGELTELEKAQAKYFGVLEFTNDTVGNYKNALDQGLLAQSEFAQTQRRTSEIFGKELNPAYAEFLKLSNELLKNFNQLATGNSAFVLTITGLSLAFAGLIGALGISATLAAIFGVSVGSILSPILLVIGVIAVLGGVIYGLYLAWQNNLGGIQDITKSYFDIVFGYFDAFKPAVDFVKNAIGDFVKNAINYITTFKDNWQERLGEIIGFFITLPFKLPFYVAQAVRFIFDILSKVDWGKAWEGLAKAGGAVIDSIKKLFSAENLKGIANGLRSFFIGLVKGIFRDVPLIGGLATSLVEKLPKFASGGLVKGRNVVAMLNDGGGEEFVMNAEATKQYLPILRAMNSGQTTDKRQYNYNNKQEYNNYSSDPFSFGIGQRYRSA